MISHRGRARRSFERCPRSLPYHRHCGQALVEFALVIPLFLILLIGVIEFAFVFNTALGLNNATRVASLAAAEAGNTTGADCPILNSIQTSIGVPMNLAQIQSVTIFKADPTTGQSLGPEDVYAYDATAQSCSTSGATYSVNFQLPPSPATYPATGSEETGGRCDVLEGCSTTVPLDYVGVSITYHYNYHTPLGNFLALPGWGSGFNLSWSNVMRMEPTL